MIKNIEKLNKGFSLVEIVVYIGIFSVISTAIITSSVVVISSFSRTRSTQNMIEASSVVMERLTREIRQGSSVDIGNSVLGSNPGVLQLNSIDSDGNNRVVKFVIENGALNIYQNGTLIDNLLGRNVSVGNLIFRKISTGTGEAVKIELNLNSSNVSSPLSVNFYDTVLMRGGY